MTTADPASAPRRIVGPYDWPAILELIRAEFAYMEGRIDPPSSMHRLTPETIAAQARTGEVWVIEADARPIACMFLTIEPQALYLGKVAVAGAWRRRGLARMLADTAAARARALGKPRLRLQTRIEMTEVHASYAAMGFTRTGETAHPGYDRPTSITMERSVDP